MPPTERPASDIPFERLFPQLDDSGRARLTAAARALDLRRSLDDPARWFWNEPDPSAPEPEPEPQPHVLGTALLLYESDGDWLELGLDVWHQEGPHVSVTATVEVACWCELDHNMHAVQRAEWNADSGQALVEAFNAAALSVIRRIDGPRDPRDLRTRAGLPNPPEPVPEAEDLAADGGGMAPGGGAPGHAP